MAVAIDSRRPVNLWQVTNPRVQFFLFGPWKAPSSKIEASWPSRLRNGACPRLARVVSEATWRFRICMTAGKLFRSLFLHCLWLEHSGRSDCSTFRACASNFSS